MRLLTPEHVAQLFNLKVRQVNELARQGKIPGLKVGRLWRFSEETLQQWVDGNSNSHLKDMDAVVDRIVREVS